ncbi:hypothetical protein ACVWXM_008683 [Bradyrhizobium sp. GM7.3]
MQGWGLWLSWLSELWSPEERHSEAANRDEEASTVIRSKARRFTLAGPSTPARNSVQLLALADMPKEIRITLWSLAAACVVAFSVAALVSPH